MFKLLCVPRLLFVCLLSAACDGHTRSEIDGCKSWRCSTETGRPPAPSWTTSQLAGVQANTSFLVFFPSCKKVSSTHAICQSLSWYVTFDRCRPSITSVTPFGSDLLSPLSPPVIKSQQTSRWKTGSFSPHTFGDVRLSAGFFFWCVTVVVRRGPGSGRGGGEWRSRSFRGNSGGEVNFLLIWFQGKKKKGHYPKWGFGLPCLPFKLVIRNILLFWWHLWCFWMVFPGGHLCIRMNFKLTFFCSMLIKMELWEKANPPPPSLPSCLLQEKTLLSLLEMNLYTQGLKLTLLRLISDLHKNYKKAYIHASVVMQCLVCPVFSA